MAFCQEVNRSDGRDAVKSNLQSEICNSGQATLSDGLCHGYLGRFSLRGSLAGGGHAPPPSGTAPGTAICLRGTKTALIPRAQQLGNQGREAGAGSAWRRLPAGSDLLWAAQAGLLRFEAQLFVRFSWRLSAAILETAAGCLPGCIVGAVSSPCKYTRPPAIGSMHQIREPLSSCLVEGIAIPDHASPNK